MKKQLLFVVFYLFAGWLAAQAHFRYGSMQEDRPRCLIEANDKNFLIAGHTRGFGSGANGFLMKVKSDGTVLWTRQYPGINDDYIFDIAQLPDQSLVMTGYTASYTAQERAFVMKTDSLGNVIWMKLYDAIGYSNGYKIVSDTGTGLYMAGYSQNSSGVEGIFLLHLNSNGSVLWSKWMPVWDHQGDWWPLGLAASPGGGVVICGTPSNAFSTCCWKFDSSGNLVWSKEYTPSVTTNMLGTSLTENIGGGDLLLGFGASAFQGSDFGVMHIDNNTGALYSFMTYGGPIQEGYRSIGAAPQGDVLLCGFTNSAGNGGEDACMMRIDNAGNVLWCHSYGSAWGQRPTNALLTSDGGYALTGQTWSFGNNADSSKIHFVKTDNLGNIPCNEVSWVPTGAVRSASVTTPVAPQNMTFFINTVAMTASSIQFNSVNICGPLGIQPDETADAFLFYPNPSSSLLNVTLPQGATDVRVTIRSATGALVYAQQAAFVQELTIDPGELAAGIYIAELLIDGELHVQKLIRE